MNLTEYYFNKDFEKRKAIHWELLKVPLLRYRETAFVPIDADKDPVLRYRNIGTPSFLIKELGDVDFPFHFFCSIQRLRHSMEVFKCVECGEIYGSGSNCEKCSSELKPTLIHADMRENWDKLCWGWDFVVDIDGEGSTTEKKIDNAYQKALKVWECYRSYGLPFSVVFSGRGFHYWIFWEDLKQYFKPEDYGRANKQLTAFVAKKTGVKLDTVVAGANRDLIRVPYSLNFRSNLCCLPLTDEQFIDFNSNMATPESVYTMDIRDRGMMKREGALETFIEDFKDGKK